MEMARFAVTCFLLTIATCSLSVISGLKQPRMNTSEFPTSTSVFLTGIENHSDYHADDRNHIDEMLHIMENHLLRMLKLSVRPPAGIAEPTVPGYIRALQLAADSLSPSAVTLDGNDHLTRAVRAMQGTLLKVFSD